MLKKAVDWVKEHPYALCLLYFIPYLLYFELLEAFAVPRFIIHCPIDDWIPFHEGFVIPYFAWFPMLAASLGYFLFHSRKDFLDLCFIMFSGMTICLLIYTILPNGLQLRPTIVHDNLLARIAVCHRHTNQCLSLHPCFQYRGNHDHRHALPNVFPCGARQESYPGKRNCGVSFNGCPETALHH